MQASWNVERKAYETAGVSRSFHTILAIEPGLSQEEIIFFEQHQISLADRDFQITEGYHFRVGNDQRRLTFW